LAKKDKRHGKQVKTTLFISRLSLQSFADFTAAAFVWLCFGLAFFCGPSQVFGPSLWAVLFVQRALERTVVALSFNFGFVSLHPTDTRFDSSRAAIFCVCACEERAIFIYR